MTDIQKLIEENKLGSDAQIRERQKKIDKESDLKMREGMEKEEDDIRGYFDEMQRPIKEDPTLVRKRKYEEKMSTFKSVMADVQFRTIVKQIINFQGSTPEEEETIVDCKRFIKDRCYEGIGICMFGTSMMSFYNRRYISRGGIAVGVGFGLVTGTFLGFIRSTQYVLQRFEELGPEYYLGRMAIQEIQDYRMDIKLRKPA